MVTLALGAGVFSFFAGAALLLALPGVDDDPEDRLFQLNTILGSATMLAAFGAVLVYHAASSLGRAPSAPVRQRIPWSLLLAFPLLIGLGQLLILDPSAAPWLFPFVNIGIVAIPSVLIAAVCLRRYQAANPWSWPMTWRETVGAFGYGAIGAVLLAGIINTAYLQIGGWLVLQWQDIDPGLDIQASLQELPRTAGILFDLSALSLVAPLAEEFLKGLIVALFFWRDGSAARCFVWGVLAGTGFNLVETFANSLALSDAQVIAAEGGAEQWWVFGVARAGAAAMHALAAGFAALAFFGLLNRRWPLVTGYLLAVLLHANWNAAVYLMAGDTILSRSGPGSLALALVGLAVLVTLATASVALLWTMSGSIRDEAPAVIYRVLGMLPAGRATPPGVPLWLDRRLKTVKPA